MKHQIKGRGKIASFQEGPSARFWEHSSSRDGRESDLWVTRLETLRSQYCKGLAHTCQNPNIGIMHLQLVVHSFYHFPRMHPPQNPPMSSCLSICTQTRMIVQEWIIRLEKFQSLGLSDRAHVTLKSPARIHHWRKNQEARDGERLRVQSFSMLEFQKLTKCLRDACMTPKLSPEMRPKGSSRLPHLHSLAKMKIVDAKTCLLTGKIDLTHND